MLEGKNILVLGLGVSGISTIKALSNYKCKIIAYDSKTREEVLRALKELDGIDYKLELGPDISLDGVDLIVKSPGIPPRNQIIMKAEKLKISIITDLELGYLLSKTKNILAITGTNGKTSTTILVGDMVRSKFKNTYICGNIGIGILDTVEKALEEDALVIECSSFQLEDTKLFKPKVASIINLKPDHLDWHGSYGNYIGAKAKIFKNQDMEDFSIINTDDLEVMDLEKYLKSKKIYTSSKKILRDGLYLNKGYICYADNGRETRIVSISELDIFPENALIGAAFGLALDLDILDIKKALLNFKALSHRMEYVEEIEGVKFYNDSKGTNPDSTIKALESIEGNILLIAGGYDKGSDFKEMLEVGINKVKVLILLGETSKKIELEARDLGYIAVYLVKDMEEAVAKSLELARRGDSVLLSPACASWGMYHNFEERGNHFKKIVNENKVK